MTDTVDLIDAIAGDSHNIPAHENAAGYLLGRNVAWTAADWDRIHGAKVRILSEWTDDQTIWAKADVLDIEAGALTIPQVREIALWRRREQRKSSTCYQSAADAATVWHAVSDIAGTTQWVANWNITRNEAAALIRGRIVAIQYASPDAGANQHATMPGSHRTIRAANVDLSVASADWLAKLNGRSAAKPVARARRRAIRRPHPKTAAGTLGAAVLAAAAAYARVEGVHLDGAETTIITAAGAFIVATVTPARRRK